MRALLAQLDPLPGDVAATARRCADQLRSADAVDLVVFPELFLGGYDLARVHEHPVTVDGAEFAGIRDAAATTRTAVVVGFVERRGDALANALACIDERGAVAGVYRKTHLFGDEADVFEAGDELLVVHLGGHAIGPQICFDMEFPEPSRAMALAGAELLVTAAANMDPYWTDHRLAARARALDNRLPHAYVNRVGVESGLLFVGGTRAIDGRGCVVQEAPEGVEHLLEVEFDLGATPDEALDYPRQARPALQVTSCTPARGTAP